MTNSAEKLDPTQSINIPEHLCLTIVQIRRSKISNVIMESVMAIFQSLPMPNISCPSKLLTIAEVEDCCKASKFGKRLPGAFYIHKTTLSALETKLQNYEQQARSHIAPLIHFTLIKFSLESPTISYLFYPDFDTDPHPILQSSTQVNLTTEEVTHRNYINTDNPPILHRKETFLTPDYPNYQKFAQLTHQQEALGLLDNSRNIGTQKAWEARLIDHRVAIQDYRIIRQTKSQISEVAVPKIDRHKAALVRNNLSKPVRLALEAELFTPGTTFFDYGCGHGGDIQRMAEQGFVSAGWDPYYRPEPEKTLADIVNLGYIINVIENPTERQQALINAWNLASRVLIVAAQVLIEDRTRGQITYGDGIITRRNTFQKNYEQEELKTYIDQVLGVDAIPVALGIYFVFRDETQAQTFRAARFRSRTTTPRVRTSIRRFEDYRELLTPLMTFVSDRGRLPLGTETQAFQDLQIEFGNLRRAFQVVLQATDRQEWDVVSEKRRQDILVYLALSHFNQRPRLRELSETLQNDIKGLFGGYPQACAAADLMFLSLGEPGYLAACCQRSSIGKPTENGLLVHISALCALDPVLRLYEGCASRTIGRMDNATLIKFHTHKPKISYLYYPDFDREPHPFLHTSMQVDLRDLHVSYRDYDPTDNPPILHWKESYVLPDYPQREKFAKLTQQETDWALLDHPKQISRYNSWQNHLTNHCAELKGHRIIWRKDADPYQMKLVKSAQRRRMIERQSSDN
jgi:DNA phosphorothioation-associated putative methyltransferase